ncbi:energy-coupling factor ABC transporter ATP-binding protein [Kurthia huakuii]|uniref:energy-coupling factor ABC transporter ATP-binding protein n=1 Tax=Kurthia huakuii TaxID=1421019 RepID=UPI000495BCFB|nr:ABC transporter ATP-binding protein [Kurthia huakuii]MBM7700825.1 energy-coupling factor transport system ATP-binding protein [Kurthia huakuii]
MLKAEALSYLYAPGCGIQELSLTINERDCIVLIGDNGSGKTTLLYALAGLLQPQQGSVTYDGKPVMPGDIGIVFQHPDDQFITTSVLDEVIFGLENTQVPREDMAKRAYQALDDVGMRWAEAHHPMTLSGGEKQRVALAAVLAMQPKILLFDEVTAMLDSHARADFYALLKTLKTRYTIVMTTHLVEEYMFANRICYLDAHHLAFDGDLATFAAQYPAHPMPFVITLQRACQLPFRVQSYEECVQQLWASTYTTSQ